MQIITLLMPVKPKDDAKQLDFLMFVKLEELLRNIKSICFASCNAS